MMFTFRVWLRQVRQDASKDWKGSVMSQDFTFDRKQEWDTRPRARKTVMTASPLSAPIVIRLKQSAIQFAHDRFFKMPCWSLLIRLMLRGLWVSFSLITPWFSTLLGLVLLVHSKLIRAYIPSCELVWLRKSSTGRITAKILGQIKKLDKRIRLSGPPSLRAAGGKAWKVPFPSIRATRSQIDASPR